MRTRVTRRHFISGLAGLGGASVLQTLTGCAALDRIFMGQSGDLSDRVVILGGGMAGLMAAYELRKKGIPYRIFEGRGRVGGRAWTLEGVSLAGGHGELGCEWFSQDQSIFWDLAKELKLKIEEVSKQAENLRIHTNKGLADFPDKDLRQLQKIAQGQMGLPLDFAVLERQRPVFRESEGLSTQTLGDWAKTISNENAWFELISSWAQLRSGASIQELHRGAFLEEFLFSRDLKDPWAMDRFRFHSGAGSLTSALLDRVIGAIPEDRVRLHYQVVGVEHLDDDSYWISFETPEGRRRVKCRHVICTLPVSKLFEVEGLSEAFPFLKDLKGFSLSRQSKGFVVSAVDAGARRSLSQGRFLGSRVEWESQNQIWTRLWSGDSANAVHAETLSDWVKAMNQEKRDSNIKVLDSALKNWAADSWTLGRSSYLDPSKKIWAFLQNTQGWRWAGEHTSRWSPGTWAGALESGRREAAEIARLLQATNRTNF